MGFETGELILKAELLILRTKKLIVRMEGNALVIWILL